ncbi:hypothetical protein RhiirA4_469660 [Rhizophagus irregularis]|uniref:Uncharacterized protein n=1 Tax=Rhizophagus irregularis TaxID=588596 RepID=A0A2I1GZX2_9GLOM|nr:hypothetical protein RhiirA4_469660 [Rhizophagus irregularis]
MNDFPIEIREINDNNIERADLDINKSKPITKIEVSPNEEYFVIYNQKDKSIFGWNIFDADKEKHNTVSEIKNLDKICVSDDKKLVYICNNKPKIVDMNNNTHEIKLYYDENIYQNHCTFNVKGEFIICNEVLNQKILRIYSTQTKNGKWINCIYEWNIVTEKSARIFADDEDYKFEKEDIKISSNENFICLGIKYENIKDEESNDKNANKKNKIVIYSIELEIPIATLDINDEISLYNILKHIDLTKIWNSIMKYYWKVCINHLNHLSNKYQSEILPNNIQITNKYAYGILNKSFLKIKIEEKLSLEDYDKLSDENDKNIIECWNIYLNSDGRDDTEKIKDTFKHLKILLFNPYKDTLRALFREVKKVVFLNGYTSKYEDELIHNNIKWKIRINDAKIVLQVFKKLNDSSKWSLTCTKIEKHNFGKGCLLGIKLINGDEIIILTSIGLFIYYFNDNVSLTYFYYMNLNMISSQDFEKVFSEITLPLPNHDSFKLNKWVSELINNKLSLIKYGAKLLVFAIKEHDLELIDDIYKNCMNHFKQDLRNNRIFLSIITSAMPLLNKCLPKYIKRFSLETNLIIDSPSYKIEYRGHYTSPPQMVNLTGSILWTKYGYPLHKLYKKFYKDRRNTSESILTPIDIPKITFIVPYIKFANYPQDYKWWVDLLLPQPSPFVETMNRDIYKSLNGRELINFKWLTYGYVYHIIIMSGHAVLAVSFSFAANTAIFDQSQYRYAAHREQFLRISITFGFFYLFFMLRKLAYKMFRDTRNLLRDYELMIGIFVYSFTIYTSVLWLRTSKADDMNYQIIPYLYALAFYVLLSPKSSYSLDKRIVNDDPNNPWNLIPTYQVYENETINVLNNNLFILQKPDENTNTFTDFSTSFFATSLLLTGDTSSFSNWPYEKNPEVTKGEDVQASYWKMMAEVVADIELFYLLPCQRRWRKWFPEVLYFNANFNEVQEEIEKLIIKNNWSKNDFPEMKQDLLNKLKIQ